MTVVFTLGQYPCDRPGIRTLRRIVGIELGFSPLLDPGLTTKPYHTCDSLVGKATYAARVHTHVGFPAQAKLSQNYTDTDPHGEGSARQLRY